MASQHNAFTMDTPFVATSESVPTLGVPRNNPMSGVRTRSAPRLPFGSSRPPGTGDFLSQLLGLSMRNINRGGMTSTAPRGTPGVPPWLNQLSQLSMRQRPVLGNNVAAPVAMPQQPSIEQQLFARNPLAVGSRNPFARQALGGRVI